MARKVLLFLTLSLFLMAGTACRPGDDTTEVEVDDPGAEVEANKADSEDEAGIAGEADPDEADGDGAGLADAPASEGGGATRVAFETGAESARIEGSIGSGGGIERYVLQALAGQTLSLRVRGVSNGAVVLSVHDASGELLATTAGADWIQANQLQLVLKAAGDHQISVSSGASAPSLGYDLLIAVTGDGEASVDEGVEDEAPAAGGGAAAADGSADPLPIFFDAGETSTTVEGVLSEAGARRTYILRADAGQRMELSIESVPAGAVDAMVFNPGGRPMRSVSRDALVFDLSVAGDYTVSTSSSAGSASYKLTLGVVDESDEETDATDPAADDAATADDSGSEEAPTRVLFEEGEGSATFIGTLWDGDSHRYVLGAKAGQTLRLEMALSAGTAFQVTVADKAGNLLASGLEGNSLEIELPSATDYIVEVLVAPGAPEGEYTITMSVE